MTSLWIGRLQLLKMITLLPVSDFTTANGTANFTSGDDMETFTVTIKADNTPEFDETFTVTLSKPSVGALVSSTNGSAKGTDNQ